MAACDYAWRVVMIFKLDFELILSNAVLSVKFESAYWHSDFVTLAAVPCCGAK